MKSGIRIAVGLASIAAGAAGMACVISAAHAQSPAAIPRGASAAGNGWCSIVIEQDPTRFQLRVAELVGAGGTVRGSNLNAVTDHYYLYALVCREPTSTDKGA